jgi:phage shock protein PspC (stress-responsive transcriptional regulator)
MSSTALLSQEFDINENEVQLVTIVLAVTLALTTVIVFLCFIIKWKRYRSSHLEDWLILFAWVRYV